MTDFVVADAAIRQLHAHYTDSVWRQDLEAFGDCFAEDGEWRIGGRVIRGRATIMEHMRGVFAQFRTILTTFRTPTLQVGDGAAEGRTYMTEQAAFKDGRTISAIGTYHERFVDGGDRWRFSWRLFQTQYIGPADLTGIFYDNEDFGRPPAMPPLDAATVNRSNIHTTASPKGNAR